LPVENKNGVAQRVALFPTLLAPFAAVVATTTATTAFTAATSPTSLAPPDASQSAHAGSVLAAVSLAG